MPKSKSFPVKKCTSKTFDCVGRIIAFENGELSAGDTLELFAHLIKTGTAWQLQGSYGRAAAGLIESGHISKDGEILKEIEEE